MSKRLYGCIVVLAALAWSRPVHAELSVTPSPKDVGSVAIGAGGSVTDTIDSNVASPGEELDEIVVAGGATCAVFTVAPTSATLPELVASDNPLPITVTFTPTTRGTLTCTVNLLNAADVSLGTFQVTGTGLGPEIAVPATAAFGSVRVANAATLTASGDVVIQNTGDTGQNLNITALQITGDFTIPSPPTLPAAIAPGGSLGIGVVFDPSASGTRTGSLVITSNDSVKPMATVALSGSGTNAVIGVTDVAFGTVTNGTTGTLDILLSNTAAAPVGPLRVASATIAGGSWFTFDDGGCADQTACTLGIDVTTSTLVGVRCAPPATATGTQTATVTFTSDSDPGGDNEAAISCTAGRANIAVDKPALAFGDVVINTSSAAQTVTVTNNGTLPLTYSASKVGAQEARYTLGGSCFAGCTVAANGGTESFSVTFSPNVEGTADIVINLDTNDPDAGDDPFVIVVTGRGVAPRISGPVVVAVGDVEVGKTSVMQPLIVTNTGTSPLTISSATLAAGATDYTIMGTAGSQTIPAGSMGMWSVFCSPQAQGARPGTFRILSDATNAPTLDVPLTCNGTRGFLVVEPATHAFGGVAQDTTASTTVTLRNTGNLEVTGITAAVLPANVGYTVLANTVPSTLAAGASASVTVQFAPTATADGGAATVTFTGSWGTSPTTTTATLSLTGDGLTAGYDVSVTTIDFGNLRFDTQPTRTFCITNTDQAIVTIQSLVITPGANTASNEFVVVDVKKQTTCGTGGVSVELPQALAQGEILEVTVRAQPANRLGAMAATLVVGSNLAANPNRSVTLTGNSTSAMLTLVPGDTLDFGAVDIQGPPAVRQVTLRNTGNAPLDLASFARTASPSFTLALPANTTLAPNAEVTIIVTYAPTVARAAGSEETFTISHSIAGSLGAPAIGTVVVRGRGIDRDLVLGPTPVFPDTFRNPGTLGPVRIVAVTNPGEAPLTITATMVSNDAEVWKLLDPDPIIVPPGATVEIRVRFEPKMAGPAPSARLQIVNDDDDDGPPVTTKITEVVLSGNGVGRNVQLNPNRFDVGYVDVGSSISLAEALVVKSFDSEHAFTIQTIEIDGGDGAFMIEETVDGILLEPDGRRTFTVTFSPERPGEFTARVRLFLDMDTEHQAEVEIHGIAVFVDARGGGGCNTGEGVGGGALIL
ncbi:MAG: choice-of-anchor D domain-containing protein, partial [Myxococcota bacterium]|nr:choice-of-anchor D domain-containing protein [Myxococcota bacterium]